MTSTDLTVFQSSQEDFVYTPTPAWCWVFTDEHPCPFDDPDLSDERRYDLECSHYHQFVGWTYDENMVPTSLQVPVVFFHWDHPFILRTQPGSYARSFMSNTALCTDALEALTAVEGLNSDPLFQWVIRWVRTVSPDYQHAVSPVYLLLEHVFGVILSRHVDMLEFAIVMACVWKDGPEYPIPRCRFWLPDPDLARPPYEYDQWLEQHTVCDVLSSLIPLLLPRLRQSNERVRSLASVPTRLPDTQSVSTRPDFSDILLCLDIAESVSKMIPGFGSLAEGACGIIRKIIAAVETGRAANNEVISLASQTATLTIAILNAVASSPGWVQVDTNIMDFWVTLREVERTTTVLAKHNTLQYFLFRARNKAAVQELITKLETARIVFNIKSQISTSHLLMHLQILQTRMMARVDEIHQHQLDNQRVFNQKLDLIIHMQRQAM